MKVKRRTFIVRGKDGHINLDASLQRFKRALEDTLVAATQSLDDDAKKIVSAMFER